MPKCSLPTRAILENRADLIAGRSFRETAPNFDPSTAVKSLQAEHLTF